MARTTFIRLKPILIESIPLADGQSIDVYMVKNFLGSSSAVVYVALRTHKAVAFYSLRDFMNNSCGKPLCIEKYRDGAALPDLLMDSQLEWDESVRKSVEDKFNSNEVY